MTDSQSTYLDRILADKRAELAGNRRGRVGNMSDREIADALATLPPPRDLIGVLREGPAPRIIAEFKRASPSAGAIRAGAEVGPIVRSYAQNGAAAISVLTDRHFQGSLDDLIAARAAVDIPILRKDFILERSQILETRLAGADAVLLIVAALPPPSLRQLIDAAEELGLTVLCEAHDDHEIDRAMSAGARLVGVNARNLKTFEVDLDIAIRMRRDVPRSFTYVAESGVSTPDDLRRLRDAQVDAALVGSSLMRADDPGQALAELIDGSF